MGPRIAVVACIADVNLSALDCDKLDGQAEPKEIANVERCPHRRRGRTRRCANKKEAELAATQVISGPAMPLAVWRQQTEEEECNDTHDVCELGGRLDLRRGRRRADR